MRRSYTLACSQQASSYLKGLQPKQCKQVVIKILDLLNDPRPQDCSKLSGYDNYLRVDQGEYRIVYEIENDNIQILVVGPRNDDEVYKILKRKFG